MEHVDLINIELADYLFIRRSLTLWPLVWCCARLVTINDIGRSFTVFEWISPSAISFLRSRVFLLSFLLRDFCPYIFVLLMFSLACHFGNVCVCVCVFVREIILKVEFFFLFTLILHKYNLQTQPEEHIICSCVATFTV